MAEGTAYPALNIATKENQRIIYTDHKILCIIKLQLVYPKMSKQLRKLFWLYQSTKNNTYGYAICDVYTKAEDQIEVFIHTRAVAIGKILCWRSTYDFEETKRTHSPESKIQTSI